LVDFRYSTGLNSDVLIPFEIGGIMAKTIQSPGAFLTQLLEKHNLNPFRLSRDIHLSQSAVRLITLGKTRISVSVAMRLAKYFDTTPEYWLVMQMKWDIAEASKDKALVNIVKNVSKFKSGPAEGKKAAARGLKPGKKPAAAKTPKTGRRGRSAAK
jgi:addiction module HigA family antidote